VDDAQLVKGFGAVVRQLRKERGVSQEGLATKAGIDRAYMGSLERGRRNPSLTTIARVARGLDLPISELIREMEGSEQC
jgi:transcriptional regulator with XRE-family HTH domain